MVREGGQGGSSSGSTESGQDEVRRSSRLDTRRHNTRHTQVNDSLNECELCIKSLVAAGPVPPALRTIAAPSTPFCYVAKKVREFKYCSSKLSLNNTNPPSTPAVTARSEHQCRRGATHSFERDSHPERAKVSQMVPHACDGIQGYSRVKAEQSDSSIF